MGEVLGVNGRWRTGPWRNTSAAPRRISTGLTNAAEHSRFQSSSPFATLHSFRLPIAPPVLLLSGIAYLSAPGGATITGRQASPSGAAGA